MKMIVAIVRPERLEAVQGELRKVLDENDNYRLTAHPVEGHGAQQGEVEFFRGQAVRPRLIPKIQITIAVNDPYVEPAVEAIIRGARSSSDAQGKPSTEGKVGDGKIFILPLTEVIRIRTGQRGSSAI
jgi:nitrogen regulatory protein P-II 2